MKDIHDIKEPIVLSFNFIPIIVLVLVLISILILIIYLSLKNKNPNVNTLSKEEVKNTPKTKALESLNKILTDKIVDNNKTELFYSRVTDIIKIYLLEQYLTKTDSKTSSEIIKDLKNLNLDYGFVNYTQEILIDLDRLKYANTKTSKEKMIKLIESLNIWIKDY